MSNKAVLHLGRQRGQSKYTRIPHLCKLSSTRNGAKQALLQRSQHIRDQQATSGKSVQILNTSSEIPHIHAFPCGAIH